jgi:hypothetical protein
MKNFIIRLLGGVPARKYSEDVVGRQAVVNGLRKEIKTLEKRIFILGGKQ